MTPISLSETSYRLGVDVGGTFTDIVLAGSDGSLQVKKVSSTPDSYDYGIVRGISQMLEEQRIKANSIREICHSTTAATNAVLERKGAKVGLITTKGFRDVLELRRLRTPTLYDLFYKPPEPLVPRFLRLEVNERIDANGNEIAPIDVSEVYAVLLALIQQGVNSLAVCLLNSHMNPGHEEKIGVLIRKDYPQLFVSLSHQVVPAIREYERTSTTVANAYLMPMMNTYLNSLRRQLNEMGINAPVSIMQSNGGMMTSNLATHKPVFSLESGPVAGVSGALFLSKNMKLPNLLTFDMGGTTTKAAVIENGQSHKSIEYEIGAPISKGSRLVKGGGYLLMVRAVDVAEVGAGGGSVISLDKAGSFSVGPSSAGAEPGPICYDKGGTKPTISDANLLLGYLNPEYLLGGTLKVNISKATKILQDEVATPLGLPLLEAAYGVHTIANATMARALKTVTTERGRDIRNFTMIAFGGSGPCHAAHLARLLGIGRVIVPASPGLFSSLGLLSAEAEYEFVKSLIVRTVDIEDAHMEKAFGILESDARSTLVQEGYEANALSFTRHADLHYSGQVHELTIPVPASGQIPDLEKAFGLEHQQTYGHLSALDPIEITTIRVTGHHTGPSDSQLDLASVGSALYGSSKCITHRRAFFGRDIGLVNAAVISREDLDEKPRTGPVIVEEYDTTIIVPPGCFVSRDPSWNVILSWEK